MESDAAKHAAAAGPTNAAKYADAAGTAGAAEYAATAGKNAAAGAFPGRKEAGKQIMYHIYDIDVCTDCNNFY